MKILVLTDDEASEVRCSLRSAITNTETAIEMFGKGVSPGVNEVWKRQQALRLAILKNLNSETPTPPITPEAAAYIKTNLRALRDLRGLDFTTAKLKFREELSVFGLTIAPTEDGEEYSIVLEGE